MGLGFRALNPEPLNIHLCHFLLLPDPIYNRPGGSAQEFKGAYALTLNPKPKP